MKKSIMGIRHARSQFKGLLLGLLGVSLAMLLGMGGANAQSTPSEVITIQGKDKHIYDNLGVIWSLSGKDDSNITAGTISWNPETKTLTLNGLKLQGNQDLHALSIANVENMTIALKGDSEISAGEGLSALYVSGSTLTVSGGGELVCISKKNLMGNPWVVQLKESMLTVDARLVAWGKSSRGLYGSNNSLLAIGKDNGEAMLTIRAEGGSCIEGLKKMPPSATGMQVDPKKVSQFPFGIYKGSNGEMGGSYNNDKGGVVDRGGAFVTGTIYIGPKTVLTEQGSDKFFLSPLVKGAAGPKSKAILQRIPFWGLDLGARLPSGDFSVPEELAIGTVQYRVVGIGPYAFKGATITELTLPKIAEVGASAFEGCESLSALEIPASVRRVDVKAFAGCKQVKTLVLHKGLTVIGKEAFEGLEALKELKIPAGVQIADAAFKGCKKVQTLSLPEGLEEVRASVFEGLESLEEIVLPSSMKEVFRGAFKGCKQVGKLSLNEGLQNIGPSAFEGIGLIDKVVLPEAIGTVGDKAFKGCEQVSKLTLNEGIKRIGISAFEGLASLEKLEIPATVAKIGANAFKGYAIGELLSNIKNPDQITNASFMDETERANCTLYIPDGSVRVYQQQGTWQGFKETVEMSFIQGITLEPSSAIMNIGETLELAVSIVPEEPFFGKEVKWSSSNARVATVENGVVTARRPGHVQIIVNGVKGDAVGSCEVKVKKKAKNGSEATPVSLGVRTGYSVSPNPAKGICRIAGLDAPARVQVYNAIGIEVLTQRVDARGRMDVSKLPAGQYFARINGVVLGFAVE